MQIVIESLAMLAHPFIQLFLARVPERRMPDVVHQRQRLGEIGIQVQRPRHGARNLRHFQCMRQPVAEMIGKPRSENLRLRLKPPESPRMNDAIAVPRIFVAVRMRSLRKPPPPRMPHIHRIDSQPHAAHSIGFRRERRK